MTTTRTLDLLGLDAQMGIVTVRADTVQRLDLAIPNGPRLRAVVCRAAAEYTATRNRACGLILAWTKL